MNKRDGSSGKRDGSGVLWRPALRDADGGELVGVFRNAFRVAEYLNEG